MTIPEELLTKYKMETIDKHESPEDFYSTFLYVTRHICDEILEGAAASANYADELYYREVARQELDKLNGGTGEVMNAVPLDALLNTMLGVE